MNCLIINNCKQERGAAILLTFLVLTTVFVIALGISGLMLGETKMSREVPRSLRAYYAAESGIEKSLYDARKGAGANDIGSPPRCSSGTGAICLDAENATCYSIDVTSTPPNVNIKSYGCYKEVRRAIEISY